MDTAHESASKVIDLLVEKKSKIREFVSYVGDSKTAAALVLGICIVAATATYAKIYTGALSGVWGAQEANYGEIAYGHRLKNLKLEGEVGPAGRFLVWDQVAINTPSSGAGVRFQGPLIDNASHLDVKWTCLEDSNQGWYTGTIPTGATRLNVEMEEVQFGPSWVVGNTLMFDLVQASTGNNRVRCSDRSRRFKVR